ncbi:MAG: M2 family metallopeptidase [Thermoplasmata archaeon]
MAPPLDPADAARIIAEAEARLLEVSIESQRADWVYQTYITPDTEQLASRTYSRVIELTVQLAKTVVGWDPSALSPEVARKAKLLRLSLPLIAPSGPGQADELTGLVNAMQGAYGRGSYRPRGANASLSLEALEHVLAESRDPAQMLDAWSGWHAVGRSMRSTFRRYVELANQGAQEVGFEDTGSMWRSKYDMAPDAFAREVDRLWGEVRPLYVELHAYVRRKLVELYGPQTVPPGGPIPAHLLGNMWAQSWENLADRLLPEGSSRGYDLTQLLRARTGDPKEIVRYAERFFTSLGFDPLPATFWERSLFVRPRDRSVICHASAWDIDFANDLRIKMCIEVTGEDFRVIHHELGHTFYQRAYQHLPFLFRDSAHDGFHEAVGDTIALSITPDYLVKVGLLASAPEASHDMGGLFERALEKIAFLPFGLVVDQWRWKVFSGEIPPSEYTTSWWALRRTYQGIAPAIARSEEDFDPGAKYHVTANVPYMRYLLAHLLQFQFHRALARHVGWTGPIHRFSIYGEHAAGERLQQMLRLGQSRPWPDALYALSGERTIDPGAIREYFAPLERWLHEQNEGHPVGW